MKAKKLFTLCCAMLLGASLSAGVVTVASAEEVVPAFTTTQSGVEIKTTSKGITTVTGTAGEAAVLQYNQTVDFTDGASFQYVIPTASDIQIDANSRSTGNNYILVTVKDDSGYGIEFKMYALYSKTAVSHIDKMQVDVTYLDPTVTEAKGNDYSVGRQYLETFNTYLNVEDSYHTIDIHKEDGMWFFAADGYSALPVKKINKNLVLDECSVTFEVFSRESAPTVKVYPFEEGILKNYVIDGFMQLGSVIVNDPGDDTVKMKIADKRAEEMPGQLIRYREQLISTMGYDVRYPINIEYSYDVSNASAVWYALGLGRANVLSSVSKRKYDVNATNVEVVDDYSDSLASKNDGIMIQTTTGMAQPTYSEQNSRLSPYKTNSKSKPYESREDIDIVTFIVKENGTDMYINGTLIFENLVTKLSDFEDNDYLAYPYFHFFEDNANKDKGNTIVIKGVNAARRTDDTDLKVVGDSNVDLEVGLTDNDNGAISLWHYVDGTLTEVAFDLYSYDAENEKLTVKYSYFAGKAYDVYKLYARNASGSEEIQVRFSDPSLVTVPATTDKAEYTWLRGSEGDLVISVDVHNGMWMDKGFSGGGISQTQYTYTPGTDSTVGTITIKNAYLNSKKAGSYTYTIRTTNVEEEIFSCTFKIVFTDEEEPVESSDATSEPKTSGDNTSTSTPNTSELASTTSGFSCGSVTGSVFAAITALAACFVIAKKRRD